MSSAPDSITVSQRRLMRRPPIDEATRGDLRGTGGSARDARADLGVQIDAALKGPYSPRLVTYRGHTALVYRELSGWTYTLVREDAGTDGVHDMGCIQGHQEGLEATLQDAAHHVISNACGPDDIWDDGDLPDFLTDARKRHDLIGCFRVYRAHRWARANGIEGDVHRWACEHSREARFVERPGAD